jgi:CubicO group peptidase (beta-lactamase class C family)
MFALSFFRTLVFALVIGAAPAWGQAGLPVDATRVDAVAQEALRAWQAPGCAVAIVSRDRVLYAKGYGVKELGKPDPVTTRTVFAIGSTTKAFTAAAVAMLVDEGRMQWDDKVRLHLPAFRLSDPHANELVTVRDLLSHRTGLSRNDLLWYNSPLSRSEILESIGKVALTKPFRSAWQYQNMMFLAAGEAVGSASGSTWEEFIQMRILDPLGMRSTTLSTAYALGSADLASPHVKLEGRTVPTRWRNIDNVGPAGSINSSIEDLTQWLRLQMNEGVAPDGKRLISAANLREMHTPQMAMRPGDWGRNSTDETNQMSYGLGWFLQDYRGHHVVNHGGAIDGFRANFSMLPKEGLGVIVLSNLGEDNLPEALRWSIFDILLGIQQPKDWNAFLIEQARRRQPPPRKPPVPGTAPTHELAAFAGGYSEPAYGLAQINEEQGKLVLYWSNFRLPLEHFQYDTFAIRDPRLDGLVTFHLDTTGTPRTLEFLELPFTRAAPAIPPDAAAARIVSQLKLKGDERVIVRFDPTYLSELTGPIRDAIAKAGGSVSATLPYISRGALSGDQELAAAKLQLALAKSTVYLWMPLRETLNQVTDAESKLLVEWLGLGGARREIHFHWNGGSVLADGLTVTHPAKFDPVYSSALDIDYAQLGAAQDRAIPRLRAGLIRVRTPAGTDITFRAGDRPFNKQDGDASPARMDSALVPVDREIELPAGVLRVAPIESSVNGIVVIPEARFGDQKTRLLRLRFVDGVAVEISAAQNVEAARKAIFTSDIAARSFREFGLGFNPKLVMRPGSPVLPYFAYGAGMVRMSLGDNAELGGAVRGQSRRWFFFPDATVEAAGGRILVDHGRLIPN